MLKKILSSTTNISYKFNRCNNYVSKRYLSYHGSNSSNKSALINSPFQLIVDDNNAIADVLNSGVKNIRNIAIIAHIDHGKSTLADRLLEYADTLAVERERGITVKAQTASMFYKHESKFVPKDEEENEILGKNMNGNYLINLIDTPGHVDFSYEVSRSLAACQGVLMLVDSTQGIQAQTLANYYLAYEADLDVIPVITKMDLPNSNADDVAKQMEKSLGVDRNDCLRISAKSGFGIESVFSAVVNKIKYPKIITTGFARAMLFDSWFDIHRGVIALFSIVEGELVIGDWIASYHTGIKYQIVDLGLLMPNMKPLPCLRVGQVGYVVANIKNTRDVKLGDTFYKIEEQEKVIVSPPKITPLPGFRPSMPMVYAGLFPIDADDFDVLKDAVEKLTLNDASVVVEKESSVALGLGFRCGFLGVLHMEVFHQRLEQEFGANVISTAPTVPYILHLANGKVLTVSNPAEFPEASELGQAVFEEPMVNATIIAPIEYLGSLLELCQGARGEQKDLTYINETSVMLKYLFPLNEILADFYSQLKSITAGFASFEFEPAPAQKSAIAKLEILLNSRPVDALASICHASKAVETGKKLCASLKDNIPRGNFEIIIQAKLGKQFVARERIAPYRKDVLTKSGKTVGGGDVTRKKKLLEKQKEGKKKMKMIGEVTLTQEAIWSTFKQT